MMYFLLFLLLLPTWSWAATIYLDGDLTSDCTTGNYSIANRNCTGSDGNAWNTVAEIASNDADNDVVRIRSGTYAVSTKFTMQAGETLEGYLTERPTWNASTMAAGTSEAITFNGKNNGIVRNFTLTDTRKDGIRMAKVGTTACDNLTTSGMEVTRWNLDNANGIQGIYGEGCTDILTTENYVHDPAGTLGDPVQAIKYFGSGTTGTISHNAIECDGGNRCDAAIAVDAIAAASKSAVLIEYNDTRDTVRGVLIELSSKATIRYNVIRAIDQAGGDDSRGIYVRAQPSSGGQARNPQVDIFYNTIILDSTSNLGGISFFDDCAQNSTWNGTTCTPNATEGRCDDCDVRNNVIYANGSAPGIVVGENSAVDVDNTWLNNRVHRVSGTTLVCWSTLVDSAGNPCTSSGATQYTSISTWNSDIGAAVDGNQSGDPLFVNFAGSDYNLQSDSAARNAAVAISGYACNTTCDMGVFQPLEFSSVTASGNTILANFTNNVFPPYRFLDGAACSGTNRSAVIDGGSRTISACQLNGTTQVQMTFSGAVVSTTATMTITADDTDSIAVGCTHSACPTAKYATLLDISGQSLTVAGGTATLTQTNCRFESAGGSEATPDSTFGSSISLVAGSQICNRCLVDATVATSPGADYALARSATSGGTYVALTNTASDSIPYFNASLFPSRTHGEVTTEQLAGASTFVAGVSQLNANAISAPTLASGQGTELLGCFTTSAALTGQHFFKWIRTATALDAWTVVPDFTIAAVPSASGGVVGGINIVGGLITK